jgi:hypothetical protein
MEAHKLQIYDPTIYILSPSPKLDVNIGPGYHNTPDDKPTPPSDIPTPPEKPRPLRPKPRHLPPTPRLVLLHDLFVSSHINMTVVWMAGFSGPASTDALELPQRRGEEPGCCLIRRFGCHLDFFISSPNVQSSYFMLISLGNRLIFARPRVISILPRKLSPG